jgi:excisionase family DNA binding protein
MGVQMPHDRYQTVQELAERLEVGEATVRQCIKAGKLRAIDIGKGWRIADTDLARFLSTQQTVARGTDGPAAIDGQSEGDENALAGHAAPSHDRKHLNPTGELS